MKKPVFFAFVALSVAALFSPESAYGGGRRRPGPSPTPTQTPEVKLDIIVEVFELNSETRIPGATVTLSNGASAQSDSEGRVFFLNSVLPGNHSVTGNKEGYENATTTFSAVGNRNHCGTPGDSSCVRLELERVVTTRKGIVRIENTSLRDDTGVFNAIGASMFPAIGLYKHDRAKLERNLEFLSKNGFDYFRALTMVGWWPDMNPADPDWADRLAAVTDFAYDRYGIRVQWTIFADAQGMAPTSSEKQRVVDAVLNMSRGREHKIILIEVANEFYQNGVDMDQVRDFSRYLKDRTEILIAGSSGGDDCSEQAALYGGDVADVMTMHHDRDYRLHGWRAAMQPFGWHACQDGSMPRIASSNEPIGPGSSVNSERDPYKLVSHAITAFQQREPFYVFHSRAGVGLDHGGCASLGTCDLNGKKDLSEMPSATAFKAMRSYVPSDLASWQIYPGNVANNPIFIPYSGGLASSVWADDEGERDDGVIRLHTVTQGNRFFGLAMGIRRNVRIEMRQDAEFDAIDPVTGLVLSQFRLRAGESFTLQGSQDPEFRSGEISSIVLKGQIGFSTSTSTASQGLNSGSIPPGKKPPVIPIQMKKAPIQAVKPLVIKSFAAPKAAVKLSAKPVAKRAVKPAAKPAAKSAAKTAAKPAAKPNSRLGRLKSRR